MVVCGTFSFQGGIRDVQKFNCSRIVSSLLHKQSLLLFREGTSLIHLGDVISECSVVTIRTEHVILSLNSFEGFIFAGLFKGPSEGVVQSWNEVGDTICRFRADILPTRLFLNRKYIFISDREPFRSQIFRKQDITVASWLKEEIVLVDVDVIYSYRHVDSSMPVEEHGLPETVFDSCLVVRSIHDFSKIDVLMLKSQGFVSEMIKLDDDCGVSILVVRFGQEIHVVKFDGVKLYRLKSGLLDK